MTEVRVHGLQMLHGSTARPPGGCVGSFGDSRGLAVSVGGREVHGGHLRSLYDASAWTGDREHGVEVAAGVEFGVGLDDGRAHDARLGLVQGDQLEGGVSGVELSGRGTFKQACSPPGYPNDGPAGEAFYRAALPCVERAWQPLFERVRMEYDTPKVMVPVGTIAMRDHVIRGGCRVLLPDQ